MTLISANLYPQNIVNVMINIAKMLGQKDFKDFSVWNTVSCYSSDGERSKYCNKSVVSGVSLTFKMLMTAEDDTPISNKA